MIQSVSTILFNSILYRKFFYLSKWFQLDSSHYYHFLNSLDIFLVEQLQSIFLFSILLVYFYTSPYNRSLVLKIYTLQTASPTPNSVYRLRLIAFYLFPPVSSQLLMFELRHDMSDRFLGFVCIWCFNYRLVYFPMQQQQQQGVVTRLKSINNPFECH